MIKSVYTSRSFITSLTSPVLQWCNAHPPNARPINAMLLCYRNIFKGFHSANGSAWAVQALDSGLLTATLRACKWIDAAEHPELFGVVEKLLSDMLSKYLIFRSVLRVVRRCLRQVTKLGLGTKESAGALWGAWRVFQVLAEERLSLLDAWDRKGGRSERQLCSRLQCTRQDDEALKRCSGCLGPTYCSKECQRLSWPLHKRGCRESRQMLLDGLEMPRDKLDVSFIRFITKLEINRRLPKILRDALQAGVPRSTIVLDINHTVVPMTFTVKRVSDFGPPRRSGDGGEDHSPAGRGWRGMADALD
ncbi:hypothetical protein PLICRDRAFT_454863 [Plicaturopsis crispa FD-325 SS-3]|uniref:MYND-type domain-containing protein n=1 Tax=Plicaturopsis crispa FD-325 SS-3 TaxID=944288 RepID=A0A0C9SVX9_PLICR|nr:hypothetical protein PLICRDRAFT_454863 [Plicaturopsis crispa FD-325 SS-3]